MSWSDLSPGGLISYSSHHFVVTSHDSAPQTLYQKLEKRLGKYEHRNVGVLQFVQHVWGLDQKTGKAIMAMSTTLDKSDMDTYRQSAHEDDLHTPFLAISNSLLKEARVELGEDLVEPLTDTFWDRLSIRRSAREGEEEDDDDEVPDLVSLWKPLPKAGKTPNLSIAKHILEFKRLPRARKPSKGSTSSGVADSNTTNIILDSSPSPPSASLDKGDGADTNNNTGSTSTLKQCFDLVKNIDDPDGGALKKARVGDHLPQLPLKNSLMGLFATQALASTCRKYVAGMVIDMFDITLCYFDRFLIATSSTFSFQESPAELALVLYAMSRCDRFHASFDPHLRAWPSATTDPVTTEMEAALTRLVRKPMGSYFKYPCSPDERGEFSSQGEAPICAKVTGMIRRPDDLLCRGTTVYKVRQRLRDGSLSNELCALKLSWPPRRRTSEIEVIKYLKEKLPQTCHVHLPDFVFTAAFSPEDLDLPWLHFGLKLNEENSHNRVLRVMMGKMYCKLWEVGSIENFKQVWLDCLELLHLIHKMGRVLHRDLSEHNLMAIQVGDSGVKGVVNDWDMSKFLDKDDDPLNAAEDRIGTPPFMATGLLMPDTPAKHYFWQELESMFWILIWAALHYNLKAKKRDKYAHRSVAGWLGNMDDNLTCKMAIFSYKDGPARFLYPAIKREFKPLIEEWIEPLRNLFSTSRFQYARNYTPDSDESTYNNRITFKTFMKTINVTPRTWGIPNFLDDDT
ncbi:hypothetical protein FA13DRAFT_1794675 [Coprinellus micaceus]|uniref:Fungal-type protein kinase domain-containing protein n=1 Tax=Coprinellus micaceus TaxID=71717 RepID=A0A4Y7T055_COPMI|nr:hypothetical protein FA13DRAFT_1794675 [Coprinellus micaceus]